MTTIWERNPEMLTKLREMAAEGASAIQVAKNLGITKNAVIGKADRMGIRFKSRRNKPRRVAHALQNEAVSPRQDGPSAPRRFSWEGVGA